MYIVCYGKGQFEESSLSSEYSAYKVILAAMLVIATVCCCPLLPSTPKETATNQVIHLQAGEETRIVTTSWEGVWLTDQDDLSKNMQVQISDPAVVSLTKLEAKKQSGITMGGLNSFHLTVTLRGEAPGVAQISIGVDPSSWNHDPLTFTPGPRNPTHYYTVAVGQPDNPPLSPLPTPTPSPIQQSQVDLNNDGQPETIQLAHAQATISSGGQVAWQSPPTWQVVQVAISDFNRDLQPEITLLVWRPFQPWPVDRFMPHGGRINDFHNADGQSCHVILIGWKRGAYRELWAGSAMSAPLRTLEAADTNGDGWQELVATESDYADSPDTPARATTVWEWNGFGFTLLERSLSEPQKHGEH